EARQYVPNCATYVTTTTTYDNLGRVSQVSNPYCSGSETAYYTTTAYDGLSRVTKVTYQDGSIETHAPVNNQLTITDPAAVKRLTVTDAAGRISSVTEYPKPSGTQVTSYVYDAMNDLLAVAQNGQSTCT